MYLVKSNFYRKKGLDISIHPRYQAHTKYDSFEIVYFLSEGKYIPSTINPEEVHIRYASLLWNYDIQNLQAGAVTDNEAPLKPVRNHTKSNSRERITIQ
ncbi:hypothetical protein R3W88_008047 [Solanum pinnatisectum]|uniref:Uncharacterized protein n=1 Tax=Solanum pinnatisectum TaxID=50273 RepID=A0AAV9M7I1_9SOLN|nr:hypothetical protein R3W88_008047 [Solanum pinnatisectum]